MNKQICYSLVVTALLLVSCTNKPKAKQNKAANTIAEQFNVSIHYTAASLPRNRIKTMNFERGFHN